MAISKRKTVRVKEKEEKKPKITAPEPKKGSYFPQIIRKITASYFALALRGKWFSWRLVIILLIVSLILLNLIRFGQNLYSTYQEAQVKQGEKRAIEAEIVKWEKVVKERSNYRDAYFELAVLTYKLNRIEETKRYLNKVFELDPNYQPARELERLLK